MLLGIEIYKRRPIFYGLGNFIFHTRMPPSEYPRAVWQSTIADCVLSHGALKSLTLRPIVLTGGEPGENSTDGCPFFVPRDEPAGNEILARLTKLSTALGTKMQRVDGLGQVVI